VRRADGQATVELVALVPLLVAVGFAVVAVLAAGRASSAADAAAESAAVAIIRGTNGADAARRSLAGLPRDNTSVRIRGGRVRVTVRPPLPLLAGLLSATAEADAGRAAPVVDPLLPIRGGDGQSAAPADESSPVGEVPR
jgi:hypothetical protein